MNTTYNAQNLIGELEELSDTTLVFSVDDAETKPGYHVTEIKQASVSSLDCKRGQETWQEVVIQLLDGWGMPTQKHMPVAKFLDIVKPSVAGQEDHQLYFEFSPGNKAINKLFVSTIESSDKQTTIHLNALKPECKPMTKKLSGLGTGCCSSKQQSCC